MLLLWLESSPLENQTALHDNSQVLLVSVSSSKNETEDLLSWYTGLLLP